MSKGRRAILVDHASVLPFGHNRNALIIFGKALAAHFTQVVRLAPRQAEAAEDGIRQSLYCPYYGMAAMAMGESSRPSKPVMKRLRRLRTSFVRRADAYLGIDYRRWRTRMDWRRVFASLRIDADDFIFFPSADYYGCLSLLDHLAKLPADRRPGVHVRLIGVMETAGFETGTPLEDFQEALKLAWLAGCRLSVSAETPSYADELSRAMHRPVIYLPYPLANPLTPAAWDDAKTVALIGQGRKEKGFFRLLPIMAALGESEQFAFAIQDMRGSDPLSQPSYRQALRAYPNVRLHPPYLTQSEIDENCRAADIVLLPYDRATYAMRGSAVYQEAVAQGRPVVCSEGTAIADMVQRYGNGVAASSDGDFAAKLVALAAKPRDAIVMMTAQARNAYDKDFEAGLAGAMAVATRAG